MLALALIVSSVRIRLFCALVRMPSGALLSALSHDISFESVVASGVRAEVVGPSTLSSKQLGSAVVTIGNRG